MSIFFFEDLDPSATSEDLKTPLGALRLTVPPRGAKSMPTAGRGPQRTSRENGGPDVLPDLEASPATEDL